VYIPAAKQSESGDTSESKPSLLRDGLPTIGWYDDEALRIKSTFICLTPVYARWEKDKWQELDIRVASKKLDPGSCM
jgi:hypothetical protein